MKRTFLWLASLVCAALVTAWLVDGPPRQSPPSSFAPPAPSTEVPASGRPSGGDSPILQAATISAIMALPHDFSQTHAAYALAAAADEARIKELIAEAQTLARRSDRVTLTSILVSRYGEIDPVAAVEFVARTELEPKRELLFPVFNSWAKLDLDAAIVAASRLDEQTQRLAAGEAIARAYADDGASAVAGIVARLTAAGIAPNPNLRPAAGAAGEPEAALAAAMALPRDQATMLVGNIGVGWASQDPEAAFAYTRNMEDDALRRRMLSGVFYSWIDRDPERVFGLLDGQLSNDERSALINSGLARLAQRDPQKALELSQQIANTAIREAALQRTFTTWAEADPHAAALALENVASPSITVLQRIVGAQFARRAPAAALEWITRIGNGQPSADMIAEVARGDTALALSAALAQKTPEFRTHTLEQIAQALAVDDVTAATDFWQQVPAEYRAPVARRIVMIWAQRDANAAARWVTSLPPGSSQQESLGSLLIMLGSSPDAANYAQLLSLVESSEDRDSYGYNRIATLIRNGNPAAAQAELSRLSLSPNAYRRARELLDANVTR